MNKLVRGKTSLIIVSVVITLLSVLLVGGSVGLIIWGANVVGDSLAVGLVLIIVGSIMAILFLGGIVYGLILYFTGKSLVATNGSLAQDNLGIGTANMKKCGKCGTKVESNQQFCSNCGHELSDAKKCTHCGVLNKSESNNCTACGEKLK